MFYEPSTKTTYASLGEFRLAYRNTSFGELDTEEERNHFGLFSVVDQAPPYDGKLTELVKGEIEQIEGRYVQMYTVKKKDLPVEEYRRIFNRRFEDKLYDHYDAEARKLGWDDRKSLLQRAGFPNHYREEAEAFGKWMGECDVLAYRIMNEITDGIREIPHGPEFFIRGLPKLEIPKE